MDFNRSICYIPIETYPFVRRDMTRIARIQEAKVRNELPVFEDILPIREPDKEPTAAEMLLTTDEGHEGLVQVIKELEQLVPLEIK